MDSNQKACIYLDHNSVIKKSGDIEQLFSKSYVKAILKDNVLVMEPTDSLGSLNEKTIYFNEFYDPQFLQFVLSYFQARNVHGIVLARIGDKYIDTKTSDDQLREILGGDLDNSDFIKPSKNYDNALDMIAESPLYNPESAISQDKEYQKSMKTASGLYKEICEKCSPELYTFIDALVSAYENDMLSVIFKLAFKQGYFAAAAIAENVYVKKSDRSLDDFEFEDIDDEVF